MGHRSWLAVGGVLAVLAGCSASTAAPTTTAADTTTLAQVQVIGTHDSYHQELSAPEQAAFDDLARGVDGYQRALAYRHPTLADQLEDEGVRSLELDLYPDPDGGRYAEPASALALGLGPLATPPGPSRAPRSSTSSTSTPAPAACCSPPAWTSSAPGPTPTPTTCPSSSCSSPARATPGRGRRRRRGAPVARGPLDDLDAEIRSRFDPADLVTPDDVRQPGRTLER